MSHYKIQKNIPIPVGDWRKDQYPLSEMEVGDCFTITFAVDQKLNRTPITKFEKLNPSFKFLCKKIGLKQYRIWRIPATPSQEAQYAATQNSEYIEGQNEVKEVETPAEEKPQTKTRISIPANQRVKGEPKVKAKTGKRGPRGPYNIKKKLQVEDSNEPVIVSAADTIIGEM